MQIKKIDIKKDNIDDITTIHLNAFTGFFLTFMGRGFLNLMYKSYAEHSNSGIIVAFEKKKLIGFLAYSENLSALYKYMIKKRLIMFAWYSLGAFLRRPTVFMRLVRAFLKPSETKREESYVELASIGVDPNIKSKGVGTQLISELKKIIDFSKYAYITLETDVIDNELANNFYKKNEFSIVREFETNEGRKMFEYRYTPTKKEL